MRIRGLDRTFINDLLNGQLSCFLEQVRSMHNLLTLEIRENYINIYYRGGSLLRIGRDSKGYNCVFNTNYCVDQSSDSYKLLSSLNPYSIDDFKNNIQLIMNEMDSWFAVHPKKEREFQHYLSLYNPSVIDVEYNSDSKQFDMIAVHEDKLIIIENKYGTGAVSGTAGLSEHYKDICGLLANPVEYADLIRSIKNISENKHELWIPTFPVTNFDETKTEILFILANYNMRSKTLNNERKIIKSSGLNVPVKVLFLNDGQYIIDYNKAVNL